MCIRYRWILYPFHTVCGFSNTQYTHIHTTFHFKTLLSTQKFGQAGLATFSSRHPNCWAHLCLCTMGCYASLSVCPSVLIPPKFRLENNSYLRKYVFKHNIQYQYMCKHLLAILPVALIKVYATGRWALINVKLLQCDLACFWALYSCIYRTYQRWWRFECCW